MDTAEQSASSQGGETIYAVSFPPAMYARDILRDPSFARAMGYGWIHDEDTEFIRRFRQQVEHQAEIYEEWLRSD